MQTPKDTMQVVIVAVVTAITSATGAYTAVESRLSSLAEKITSMKEQMGRLEARFEHSYTRAEADKDRQIMELRLNSLDSRIRQIEPRRSDER